MHRLIVFISLTVLVQAGFSQSALTRQQIAGSATLENQAYRLLRKISDQAGGRLPGTPANRKTQEILTRELQSAGYTPQMESFSMPAWFRGNDRVLITEPFEHELEVVALGYTQAEPTFEGEVIYLSQGSEEDFSTTNVKNKIVLVTSEAVAGQPRMLRQEVIATAGRKQGLAVLFINERAGNINLAGTGDFDGHQLPLPAFSLTREQGLWIHRLLEEKQKVVLRISVESYCRDIRPDNLIVPLPGESTRKIVVGAHFDSWDLAQGSIDNGLGTAILYDVARLMKLYSLHNRLSIEFIWFNAEELGLFGSKSYMKMHRDEDIVAMINMDMTGAPTGFNAMGFDEFKSLLQELADSLQGYDLSEGVTSRPWTNSDHMPFMLQGIPIITLNARLDEDVLHTYHSQSDTFDKVNRKYLSDAVAVMTLLVRKLANTQQVSFSRKSGEDMVKLFKKCGLDQKLKKQNLWPYQSQ
jgi:Iap family predicted aminopeptidase